MITMSSYLSLGKQSITTKKFKDLDWESVKPQREGGIVPKIHIFGTPDPLTTEHLKIREMFENPVEEFPIQKIHMQTMYKTKKSETNIIITKSSVEHRVMVSISDEENIEDIDDYYRFSFTKERFSDLVDLMIEARKDLLK